MGFCFSCCRRRDKKDKYEDGERERLLHPETDPDSLRHPEERTLYEKVADVLAALHAGKLPSQAQIDSALRKLLHSEFFDSEPEDGGALDGNTKRVVSDMREVAEAVLQIGLEKNDDDRIQDLIYQLRGLSTRTVPIDIESPPDIRVDGEARDKVQTAASSIPTQNEVADDLNALMTSIRTLANLLLTSSAFRLIVGDLFLTARELVADAAARVRQSAEAVEDVSKAVERNVRPESSGTGDVQPMSAEVDPVGTESRQPGYAEGATPKEVLLDRTEDIFRRAQASPHYHSALRTLLYIFRKYAERVRIASTAISEVVQSPSSESQIQVITPVLVPDPRLSRALEDTRVVFERLAGGKSLEPLLQALFKTVHDVSVVSSDTDGREAQEFFEEVGAWLDNALADPSFVTSRAGRDTASTLYDKASLLLSKDTRLSENIHNLLDESNTFVEAIKRDRSTSKLFQASDKLYSDILCLLGRTAESSKHAVKHWRMTLLRSTLGWLLSRILRAIRVLPMPRVEYVSKSSDGTQLAVAIDTLLLSAEEALVPDVLSVQEFTEVRVEMDENVGATELTSPNTRLLSARKVANQRRGDDLEGVLTAPLLGTGNENGDDASPPQKRTNVATTSRVRVHVEGLRIAAHDVGYYASYARNSWLGYTDEGLLSIEIGRSGRRRQHRGEGLMVDVELEIDSDLATSGTGPAGASTSSPEDKEGRLFRVVDVRTAIPGLSLHIAHSRHWILNSLLTPLAGPIGRTIVPWILNAQLRSVLESLEEVLRGARAKAGEKAGNRAKENQDTDVETSASDWWDAILERFSSPQDSEGNKSEEDEEEQDVYTETHTEATLTGIVRTMLEQPEPKPRGVAPPPTESSLSIGVGAQLLPGRGEPTNLGVERESPQEAAQKVAETAREAVEDVQGKVQTVIEGVKVAGSKGIKEAARVRRLAEEAEERMENQERRERRRRGWKSRAYDL